MTAVPSLRRQPPWFHPPRSRPPRLLRLRSRGGRSPPMARPGRPRLPDRAPPARPWGVVARRLLLAVLVVVVGVLVSPQNRTGGYARYRVGDVSRDRVTAPFDFRVRKSEVALEHERQAAARA